MKNIILASQSPRRRELLTQIGLEFEVHPAGGEEIITSTDPVEVVKSLSTQKAAAVKEELEGQLPENWLVIGADTIVVYDGKILGKPKDEADAIRMLRMLQGQTHSVYTGVTLLEEGKQTEPILITSSGVVVNGNRRLSAMRELYAAGDSKYSEFTHINCMVLPASASDKEIKEIEVRLQMQPETKLAYTWVNEALTIKDLMQSGFTRDEITRDMRKDIREVMAMLQALGHAEVYLKDWRGQPEDYELVERGKQLFGDMARDLKDKVGEHLEISRRIAFLIQDNSSSLGTRAYAFNFSFGKKAPDVAEALASRLGVDLNQPPPPSSDKDEQLAIDIDDESEGSSYKPLIDVMDDQSRREEVTQELIAVCESIRASEQDQKRGQAALKAVKDANTKLLEVDFSNADPDTYGAIDAQLESILLTTQKLKAEIARMRAGARTSTAPGI